MGLYIDPSVGDKETWLAENGKKLDYNNPLEWSEIPKGYFPVILMDNGMFTAAGVAFNEREYKNFLTPDPRPKQLWIVHEKQLYTVTGGQLTNYIRN